MVDFFLLLMLAGAGDELQGIKRGIMEMADTIVITKADGSNVDKAEMARIEYKNALHLFPPSPSKWTPRVLTCSSRENKGINEVWETIGDYVSITKSNGWFWERRREQAVTRMHETIIDELKHSFYDHPAVKTMLPELENQLREGRITSYKPASILLEKYFNDR
jgi:LAO/AO transport system kinase